MAATVEQKILAAEILCEFGELEIFLSKYS